MFCELKSITLALAAWHNLSTKILGRFVGTRNLHQEFAPYIDVNFDRHTLKQRNNEISNDYDIVPLTSVQLR